MNWFVLHFSLSISKMFEGFEISGFIEMNCDKFHTDLF